MLPLGRVRLQSDEYTHSVWTYFTDHSVEGYVSIPTMTRYNQIADSLGPRGKSRRAFPAKACQHQSFQVNARILPYHAYGAGKVIVFQDSPPICSSSLFAAMVPFVPDYRWSQLNGDAFTALSAQFPEQISIANFLWELRELVELLPKFAENVIKTLAGGYLTWKFGWEPFLRDLLTLGGLVSKVTSRLEYLKKTWGKVTRLGYYVANCYEHSITTAHTEFAYNLGFDYTLVSWRSDFRAGGRLFHRMQHLNDTIGLLNAFSGALGLNNPIKAVWQALPFSFVVDWFFHVNKHLARMATLSDQTAEWQVSDITSSIKTTATIKCVQTNHEADNWGYPDIGCGEVFVELYERRCGLLVDLDVFTPDSLSPAQLTLANAMVAA